MTGGECDSEFQDSFLAACSKRNNVSAAIACVSRIITRSFAQEQSALETFKYLNFLQDQVFYAPTV